MEMEGSWLAIFPSIFVICLIHRAIVNNIPGMGRVLGGILVEIWVSFFEIWGVVGDPSKYWAKNTPGKTDGWHGWLSLMDGINGQQIKSGKLQKPLEFIIGN